MTRQKTEIVLCDCCQKTLGHLEDDEDAIVDLPHITIVMLEDIRYTSLGLQGTFEFCDIKCMRKFFKTDMYKELMRETDETTGNRKAFRQGGQLN